MSQRRDEGQLPPREEIDEGATARAHMVDPVLEAKLLHRRHGVPAADDGESVGLRDRGQEFPRPDGEWVQLEDAGGTVEEYRLRAMDHVDVVGDGV